MEPFEKLFLLGIGFIGGLAFLIALAEIKVELRKIREALERKAMSLDPPGQSSAEPRAAKVTE